MVSVGTIPRRGTLAAMATAALSALMIVPVAAQDPTAGATFGDAWETVPCDTLGVAAEIAPMADCGYVTVPEDRTTTKGTTIRLAVVRLRTDAAVPATPMVVAVGGPGGNGLGSVSSTTGAAGIAPFLAARDVVLFSQRGSKHSAPELACLPYSSAWFEAASAGAAGDQRLAERAAGIEECASEATTSGTDLSAFNSRENADDIDSIRTALGYDRIILYGQSYGTQLAQFYMRQHADSLEAVILDGILPASATSEAEYTNYQDAFRRVWTACASDPTCSAQYPDPEGDLAKAFDALEAEPQTVNMILPNGTALPLTVDGDLAMNALHTGINVNYAAIPAAASEMAKGNYSVLGRDLFYFLDPSSSNDLMFFTMVCTDDPVTTLTSADGMLPMYQVPEFEDENRFTQICPLLDLSQLPADSDRLVTSDIPTLLLQGGLDPATAVANGDIVETGLSHAYNIVVPAGNHVIGLHPCPATIMQAFMADPSQAPDTSCIDQGYHFSTPLPVSAKNDDGTASFEFTLPAGFVDAGDGTYLVAQDGVRVMPKVIAPAPPEDAIRTYTASVTSIEVPDNPITDHAPVAGSPAKQFQAEIPLDNGAVVILDIVAFSDADASYLFVVQNQLPGVAESFRTGDLPAILDTVSIGQQ